MEGILGSPALTHPTRKMVIEPTNDSDNRSPSAQPMHHREGMARRSSSEGDWLSKGCLTPGQDVLLAATGLHYSEGMAQRESRKGASERGLALSPSISVLLQS